MDSFFKIRNVLIPPMIKTPQRFLAINRVITKSQRKSTFITLKRSYLNTVVMADCHISGCAGSCDYFQNPDDREPEAKPTNNSD